MAISKSAYSLKSFITIISVLALAACQDDDPKDSPATNTDPIANQYQFERIATLPVYLNTHINDPTVADNIAASSDGDTLIYIDSINQQIGFIDITDAVTPEADGIIALNGTPHDIAAAGSFALVTVDTSANYIYPSGELAIFNIDSRNLVNTLTLDGQPESVSISPNQRYAVITIENQRDAALGDGAPPQTPAGFVYILDMIGEPATWTYRHIPLSNIADLYGTDPEPESVDINSDNIAAITLQENNHIVLVDLGSGEIINHFSAGSQSVVDIDISADKNLTYTDTLTNQAREPDGIQWLNKQYFITANEGDLNGGTRDLSIFNANDTQATPTSLNIEPLLISLGHYNDQQSPHHGNQPENITVASFLKQPYAFISSRYGNAVLVHSIDEKIGVPDLGTEPYQILPTPAQPSGMLAIPQRNLFIVSSQADDQGNQVRSAISIYQLRKNTASYPTLTSGAQQNSSHPIYWGALSGFSVHPDNNDIGYSVADNSIQPSRLYTLDIDIKTTPQITQQTFLLDTQNEIKNIAPSLVNPDDTVNLDLEGITYINNDNIWLVAEGIGDRSDANTTQNLLLNINISGVINEVVFLPTQTDDRQLRHGLSGITHMSVDVEGSLTTYLYISFQRPWSGDVTDHTRIGRYEINPNQTNEENWGFYSYPLEQPTDTKNGQWVGLSAIANINNDYIAVIERDNQQGNSAEIKRLYKFSIKGVSPGSEQEGTPSFPTLEKYLVKDLTAKEAIYGGQILEKTEGLGVDVNSGTTWIVNDNQASINSNGETRLIRHGFLF